MIVPRHEAGNHWRESGWPRLALREGSSPANHQPADLVMQVGAGWLLPVEAGWLCVVAAQMCRSCVFTFMQASLCTLILECAGIKGKRPGSALERTSEGTGHAASRRRPTSAAARFCRYVGFLSWKGLQGFWLRAYAPRQCGAPATRVEVLSLREGVGLRPPAYQRKCT